MENEENKVTEQKSLTAEEQQQAYLNAMRELEEDKKKKKRKRRLIKLGVFVGIIIAIAAYIKISAVIDEQAPIYAAIKSFDKQDSSYDDTQERNLEEKIDSAIEEYIGDGDIKSKENQEFLYKQAKKAYKKKAYYSAVYILSYCTELSDTEELLVDASFEAGKHFLKSLNYDAASVCFDNCMEFDNANKYEDLQKFYIWAKVNGYIDSAVEQAEGRVRMNLKNPSSYQRVWAPVSKTMEDRGNGIMYLFVSVNLQYSATNSFGGRIQEKYTYDEIKTIDMKGLNFAEAKRISELSYEDLCNECAGLEKE